MQGTLQIVQVPGSAQLTAYTRQVLNNTLVVRPDPPPLPPIRHVVFIVKDLEPIEFLKAA